MYLREHKRVVCGLFTVVVHISSFKTIHNWHNYNFCAEKDLARGIFEELFLLRGNLKKQDYGFWKNIYHLHQWFFSISGSFSTSFCFHLYIKLTIEVITTPLSSLLKLDGPCGIKFRVPVWRRTWNASDNSGDRDASIGTVVIANQFHVISGAISDRRAI